MKNRNFSRKDFKKGVTFPSTKDHLLAELKGAMIGDGNLNNHKRPSSTTYRMVLSGHKIDDFCYYKIHVQEMFEKLFSVTPKTLFLKKNEIRLCIYSKAIFHFLRDQGLPIGNKNYAKGFPLNILSASIRSKSNFLRGILDTDGTITFKAKDKSKLHKYPVIRISFRNPQFIRDLVNILKSFNFFYHARYNDKVYHKKTKKEYLQSSVALSGKKNLKRWTELIGSKNPKHLTKLAIWEEFGFCPPKTTLEQREKIICGQLDPYSFY